MSKANCILCDKELEFDCEDIFDQETYYIPSINNALVCESVGNYGSTIFDSLDEDEVLQFYICDDCAQRKADKIRYFKIYRLRRTEIKERKTFERFLSDEVELLQEEAENKNS